MKRILSILLVLLLSLISVAYAQRENGAGAVSFTDPALEAKVRKALDIPEGEIALAQAESVTGLDLSNPPDAEIPQEDKIADLSDLSQFPNLTFLDLARNDFHDISALAGLNQLETLNIQGSDVYDFSPLTGLTNLRDLFMDGNGKDASFLGGLTRLEVLYLGGGYHTLPEEIAKLENLTWFSSVGGDYADISVLAKLRNLTGVDLSWTLVEDISPLEGLPLTKLYLAGDPIQDYSPIRAIYDQLTEKDFTALFIPDDLPEEPLVFADANFEIALRAAMNIQDRPITTWDAFFVTELVVESEKKPEAQFVDIGPLAAFVNLQSLRFNGNLVSDLSPLAELHALTRLELGFQRIGDLSPLKELTNLEILNLEWNQIQDLKPIAGLTKLKYLNLWGNQITDLRPLASLTNLESLSLGDNPVTNYSPIKGLLPQLRDVYMNVDRPQGVPDEPIAFADANLEKALRTVLQIPEGPITQLDACLVTELSLDTGDGTRISDIGPMSYFVNLEQLHFPAGDIRDLSPLQSLHKLKFLTVMDQQITDLSPLAGLTNLEGLNAGWDQIADLSPLSGLYKLDFLDVSHNQISDPSPLAGLKNLKRLYIGDNPIRDYGALGDLAPQLQEKDFEILDLSGVSDEPIHFADKKFEQAIREAIGKPEGDITQKDAYLTKELRLQSDDFKDIGPLQYFVNLTWLGFEGSGSVKDISPVAGLTKLDGMCLNFLGLTSLEPIRGMTWLTNLNIRGNQIADLSPLEGFANLWSLDAADNRIQDVAPLGGLTQLRELYLAGNPIMNFDPIRERMDGLEHKDFAGPAPESVPEGEIVFEDAKLKKALGKLLGVTDRPLTQRDAYVVTKLDFGSLKEGKATFTDLTPLTYFVNLEELYLSGNGIRDVSALTTLTQLRSLRLESQKIVDLAPLAGLNKLELLSLKDNRVADLSALGGLNALRTLDLTDNKIEDLSPLASAAALEELFLSKNDIVDVSPLQNLPHIRALDLRENAIKDVAPLAALPQLRILLLKGNKIKDYGPLADLYTNLEDSDFKIK